VINIRASKFHPTRRRNRKDQGWSLGVSVGKTEAQFDWRVYYAWMVMEQDAILATLAHDDLLLQTNYRTHYIGFQVMLFDDIRLHLRGMGSARDGNLGATSGRDQTAWRLRADIDFRF
jgi:hypothetical protein